MSEPCDPPPTRSSLSVVATLCVLFGVFLCAGPLSLWHCTSKTMASEPPDHYLDEYRPPAHASAAVVYVVSAAVVIISVSILMASVLVCRWRRRRKQRALEEEIDKLVGERAMRIPPSRSETVIKLPPSAFTSQSTIYPRPLLANTRADTASSSASSITVVRMRCSCIRATDQRLHCGCQDCISLARSSTTSHASSGSGMSPASSGEQPAVSMGLPISTTVPPESAILSTTLELPAPLARATPLGRWSSARRARARTDENAHRDLAARRASHPRAATVQEHAWALQRAELTTAFLAECGEYPSRAPPTPALSYGGGSATSSPRVAGSPVLSDDAGETTLGNGTPQRTYSGPDHRGVALPLSSLQLAASLGRLGIPGEGRDSGEGDGGSVDRDSATGDDANLGHLKQLSLAGLVEIQEALVAGTMDTAQEAHAVMSSEGDESFTKWFTDVDWYGEGGPLSCYEQYLQAEEGTDADWSG